MSQHPLVSLQARLPLQSECPRKLIERWHTALLDW